MINLTDLSMFLILYGLETCHCGPGEFDCDGTVGITDLSMLLAVSGGPCEGDSTMGGGDPLTQWLRSATPQQVLDWWNAGMPPIGGGEDQ